MVMKENCIYSQEQSYAIKINSLTNIFTVFLLYLAILYGKIFLINLFSVQEDLFSSWHSAGDFQSLFQSCKMNFIKLTSKEELYGNVP